MAAFKLALGLALPADYRAVVARVNGFNVMGNEVYGLRGPDGSASLESVYRFEHLEVQVPQAAYLIPFSPDGGGNFYCFDTRYPSADTRSCPVVFWVSNYPYTAADPPEVVYPSFFAFVQEVIINWTLEDYLRRQRTVRPSFSFPTVFWNWTNNRQSVGALVSRNEAAAPMRINWSSSSRNKRWSVSASGNSMNESTSRSFGSLKPISWMLVGNCIPSLC